MWVCLGRTRSVICIRWCDAACVCLFGCGELKGGGRPAGGWGAGLASSEGMFEAGIQEECSHSDSSG